MFELMQEIINALNASELSREVKLAALAAAQTLYNSAGPEYDWQQEFTAK